ncbi:MAG: S1C family serine protease [Oscillospiraceae bacterium]
MMEPNENDRYPNGENDDIQRDEYHPYSDAGYVSSEEAGAVPHRYHVSPTASPEPKKPRREGRRGFPAAGVVALCLVCAILGGILGGALPELLGGEEEPEQTPTTNETVLNVTTSAGGTQVSTNFIQPGGELSASEIYSLACSQVVAITTEITYRSFYGYSTAAVSGSGFIISSNGYILTNYHVIEDANEGGYEISVLTYDGTEYTASIVGYEKDNDVAVLKIEADGLNAVTLGDSDGIVVGEDVYAVGNPLGELGFTMTKGMVSALDRDITSYDSSTRTYNTINMFQIDAAVNSGNSGGPVYNSRGEIIGIVTAKYSDTGVEGLGFAIPINDAVELANDIMTVGYVRGKAYMGLTAQTVNATVAQYYNMVEGAYVYGVEDGSAAEACGLQMGDIIVKMDDTEIRSVDDLTAAKKSYRAGESAVLSVWRDGGYIELTIVFDEAVPEAGTTGQTTTQTGYAGAAGSRGAA